ncbi:MAG: hypothetical protein IJF40_06970 [Clostridia bacterium]|nr:hypothetical protein [Clostridia bacterium]MBQ7047189.1 hypothetical protein [Oscillospiraceae bacterium]
MSWILLAFQEIAALLYLTTVTPIAGGLLLVYSGLMQAWYFITQWM